MQAQFSSLVRLFRVVVSLALVGSALAQTTFIPTNGVWKFKNNGTGPGDGWKTLDFNDSEWKSGPAKLGYGDANVVTVTEGGAMAPHPITAYFRTVFMANDAGSFKSLGVRLMRDDGAVVYLNGVEILRNNMPDGAITASTLASTAVGEDAELIFYPFTVPATGLLTTNVLAVEVHQVNATSSDLGFALELTGSTEAPPPPLPVVSISATVSTTTEPTPTQTFDPGKLTITRSGSVESDLTVYLSYEGTATSGSDYVALPAKVTIPAGTNAVELLVVANADPYSEPAESVVAHVVAPPDGSLSYQISVDRRVSSVYIMNYTKPEDVPVLSLVATVAETIEMGPDVVTPMPGKFTITRTGNLGAPLKVYLQFDGTATSGIDYVELPQSVDIPAGTNSVSLLVIGKQDSLVEGTETVIAAFAFPPGPGVAPFAVDPDHAKATVSIHDSTTPPPPLPVISIEASVPETSEPTLPAKFAPAEFTLHRTGSTNSSLVVYVHFGGTATAEADYETIGSFVEFPAGASNVTRKVFAKMDSLVEGDETVVAEVTQPPTLPPVATYQIDADKHRAVVTIHDSTATPPAAVVITEPHQGDTVFVGTTVLIKATATDPNGYVPHVEFFDGTNSIGVSEIVFVQAPPNGTPVYHEVAWKVDRAGDHVLTAIGKSSTGVSISSNPVTVTARDGAEQVHLALEVTDASATEPNVTGLFDGGMVVIKRVGGATNVDLSAYYTVTGTASNGVDFVELSGKVHFEAGQMRAAIPIVPKFDNLVEGDESVVITLQWPVCPAIFPPPPSCYVIDGDPSGTVVIHDSVQPNLPPKVVIGRPLNGAVFTLGTAIDVVAEAADADGTVAYLEVDADGKLFASGNTNRVALTWSNAVAGTHVLAAFAVDDKGATGRAAQVSILVRQSDSLAFVTRHLPPSYTPGAAFHVELRAEPPSSAHAYAVEDRPPDGWGVSNISNDGFFDATTGKVKFGPFTDATARTLTYTLTPPATATGRREFGGASSIDGVTYPIAGDHVIEQGASFHPADTDKSNFIVLNELTAYAGAWKGGSNWVVGPNPIPLSYVTRAGFLWKHGEVYSFDPSKEPPLCWVPKTSTAPDGSGDLTVLRTAALLVKPGAATDVQVKVTPTISTSAYGLEEKVPENWTVSNISDDGAFDASRSVIRWGVFVDASERTLKYTLTSPTQMVSIAHLSGAASVDGFVKPVPGNDRIIAADDSVRPLIGGVSHDGEGHVHLHLDGKAGQVGVLQRSGDLEHWEDVTTVYLPDGTLDFTDDASVGVNLYYRLQMR